VSSGRVTEDFSILLDLAAASAGMHLEPEDVPVDDGLGGTASP
jgi:3-hydroxyisobutyrate dehydrogenase